jgi:hypothetical protein
MQLQSNPVNMLLSLRVAKVETFLFPSRHFSWILKNSFKIPHNKFLIKTLVSPCQYPGSNSHRILQINKIYNLVVVNWIGNKVKFINIKKQYPYAILLF